MFRLETTGLRMIFSAPGAAAVDTVQTLAVDTGLDNGVPPF